MKPVPYHHLDVGSLLIASPDTTEHDYEKKVVLICFKDEMKILGICLNVPHSARFETVFLGVDTPTNPHIRLLDGGLDDPDHIMILHSPIVENELPSWPVNDNTYFLIEQEDISPLFFHPSNPHILVSIGYFHWEAGSLEQEIYHGHWLLAPSNHIDLFNQEPSQMWNAMMREVSDKYRVFEFMPSMLSEN
ncbi:hypothetical protein COB21_03580 [Candidatus Aerophobetes bacterium]|uniref:Uncharacterized protein n=1 Tax=Aerophobetes bacterium TaxID=2030807 RepID=A0A2A4X337_UNCAE|nr:MAG: hypothetical protein COB21_03580 [Candidatus Aerophobetes bacterium]